MCKNLQICPPRRTLSQHPPRHLGQWVVRRTATPPDVRVVGTFATLAMSHPLRFAVSDRPALGLGRLGVPGNHSDGIYRKQRLVARHSATRSTRQRSLVSVRDRARHLVANERLTVHRLHLRRPVCRSDWHAASAARGSEEHVSRCSAIRVPRSAAKRAPERGFKACSHSRGKYST